MRSPLVVATPVPADGPVAPYLRARHRNAWLATLAGIALFVGGLVGFGHYGGRSDALAKTGVHTTATVTATALYGGRFGANHYAEHIDVAFATPRGEERGVRIWIGEQDRFSLGQQVQIVYDRANPRHAQLVHGADIGPVGFPLFFAIVLGACFAVLGLARLRVCRAASRALRGAPTSMTVTSALLPRGRATGRAVFLDGPPRLTFWSLTRSGWLAGDRAVRADVYGELQPGKVLVVVAARGDGVAIGRTKRRRRSRWLRASAYQPGTRGEK